MDEPVAATTRGINPLEARVQIEAYFAAERDLKEKEEALEKAKREQHGSRCALTKIIENSLALLGGGEFFDPRRNVSLTLYTSGNYCGITVKPLTVIE